MPRVSVGIELGTVVLEGPSATSCFRGTQMLVDVEARVTIGVVPFTERVIRGRPGREL
jgi:hypothetical protein